MYTGFLGGSEVIKVEYQISEKSKIRKFYKVFKEYVEQLIAYLNKEEPKFGDLIKKL